MPQKLKDIYEELITATLANQHLTDLDATAGETMQDFVSSLSTSRVSIWRLWCFIVAFYLWLFQKQDDTFKTEIEYWSARKQVPTLKWYQQKVLNFLYGKPLVWNEDLGKFEQILLPADDEAILKIVKYCAVVPAPNKLRVKVATDNGGVPGTLTTTQATAVSSFLNQIKAAGDNIELVNNNADKLNITADIYVDPLVIDLSTGELIAEPGVKPAEDAINAYLLNLDFNGRFYRNGLIDSVQQASGITDIDLNVLESRYGTFPFANIDVSLVAEAGYFEINNLTLNYKAAE